MKFKIQIIIENDGDADIIEEVINLERETLSLATAGLTLDDSKEITSGLQKIMLKNQIRDFANKSRACVECTKLQSIRGYHDIKYRTLFGKLNIRSPRLNACKCLNNRPKTLSPLALVLTERTSPELNYLQTKWASLMSYGVTASLLNEILPVKIGSTSVHNKVVENATRIESEIDDEKYCYIDVCQNEVEKLPHPDSPITVGIDGGYVHGREGNNRKAGSFEIIVGKCLQKDAAPSRFGFVTSYDTKPKRKLYDMLISKGLQMNQRLTFLSDGGDNVRNLQHFLSPQSEHILDWFHVTMRITVINQMIKGIEAKKAKILEKKITSIKWYLWHGNAYRALKILENLFMFECDEEDNLTEKESKLWKTIREFNTYIESNQEYVVCYADRYQYGEHISTGFVESTVNELISKRMVKKQQMRWTKKGAHLLLQLRVKTLNDELRAVFCKWYPGLQSDNDDVTLKVA